jgi:zinc transport system permease protein
MSSFLTDLAQHGFLQNAIIAGILCSIAGGIVGTYVVVRRITYIAAAIAHCILGGLGAAKYFSTVWGWQWLTPSVGAVISALVSAAIIGLVSLNSKEREDSVISSLWAFGMACGILFIFKTPGYNEDLMSYLFGNILMVSQADIYVMLALDAVVVGLVLIFYNQLLAVCFDEEFSRTRGMAVKAYYMLLLCIVALTVVLMVNIVGIIMVIALLTLPVAISSKFFNRLWAIMLSSILAGTIFTTAGLVLSYEPDLPAGALTIVIAGACYFLTLLATEFLPLKAAKTGKE